MIQYRKSWQNSARIARTIGNRAVCRTFMRSVLFITTTHEDGFIARNLQIATADRTDRIYRTTVSKALRQLSRVEW